MSKLLTVGFHRLIKSKLYISLLCFSILFGAYAGNYTNTNFGFEEVFFYVMFTVSFVQISLSLGTEFSQGGMRTKIVTGYKRSTVFWSEMIISVLSSMMMVLFALFMFLIFSAHWFSKLTAGENIILITVFILFNLAFAAVCTSVCFLVASRPAFMASANILLLVGVFLALMLTEKSFSRPQYLHDVVIDDNGYIVEDRKYENPDYISEDSIIYNVFDTAIRLYPPAQANLLCDGMGIVWYERMHEETREYNFSELVKLPPYSLATITLFTAAGWLSFQKRNLR